MTLTNNNYYGKDSNMEYLSVSQYKDFMGTYGKMGCEEYALAKLKGEWEENMEESTALMIGSYVDAYFEGTLDAFKIKHPCMFKKDKSLKAEYVKANNIISRCEQDKTFMMYMSGKKQVIMAADMFGARWKIKMDSYLPDIAIVDLKVIDTIRKPFWVRDIGHLNYIEYWGYDIQGAVYQEVVYRNTGKRLPFFIAAASKEKETDIDIIWVPDEKLHDKLIEVENNVPRILRLKSGEQKPIRCGICDYCKHTKVITKPIHMDDLLQEV